MKAFWVGLVILAAAIAFVMWACCRIGGGEE